MLQKVLPKSISDHNAILLVENEVNWGPRPFKFFNHWMEMKGFQEMLLEAWDNLQVKGSVTENIWNKLKEIKVAITKWYRLEGTEDSLKISHLEDKIDRLEKRIQELRHMLVLRL